MTRVVIVGEAYLADLSIGGGPMPPGSGGGQPPGYPSHPWVPPQPGVPTHPIAPTPPGYWGGAAPPHPDQGLPGVPPGYWGGVAPPQPTHPIAPGGSPGAPSHPIVLPPDTIPGEKPEHPIYIPPTTPGVPTHPIALPPSGSSEQPEVLENWNATTLWTPSSGWVVAIVPSEDHPGVPTPSV